MEAYKEGKVDRAQIIAIVLGAFLGTAAGKLLIVYMGW